MAESKRHSIVVVEDEAVVLMLYKIKFSEWEFPIELVKAMNGFDGLLKIGRSRPILVITDLKMPGMDGLQMIKAVKQDSELEETMFVVITSTLEEELREEVGLPDDVIVLPKPTPFSVLESLIRNKIESIES